MGDVVELNCQTSLPVPVAKVLEGAAEADLDSVVVIGFTSSGRLYGASSDAECGKILWLLERCKQELMAGGDIYQTPHKAG